MRALTIGQKLLLAGVAAVGLTLAVAVTAISALTLIEQSTERMRLTSEALRNHLEGDMMHDALRADVLSAELAAGPQKRAEAAADGKEHSERFRSVLAQNKSLPLAPQLRAALGEYAPRVEVYINSVQELIAAPPGKAGARKAEFEAAFRDLEVAGEQLSEHLERQRDQDARDVARARTEARRAIIVATALSVLLSLAFGLWMRRACTRPVNQAAQVLTEIVSTMDVSRRMGLLGAPEFGPLTSAMNGFLERLQGLVGAISKAGSELSASAATMEALSQSMASGAQETASQAATVTSLSSALSEGAQTLAASSGQMQLAINEISSNCSTAAGLSRSAVETVSTAESGIGLLVDSSRSIGGALSLISQVAEQTNLLALNARIEAARAGAHGKGFTVVANEVKALSSQTAKATDDLRPVLNGLQRDADAAIQAVDAISQKIQEADRATSSIAVAVEQQTATTRQMTEQIRASADQAAQIATSISAVSKAARQNAYDAGVSKQTADGIKRLADELNQLVAGFRV